LLSTSADGSVSGLRYVHDGSEPLTYVGGPSVDLSYVVRDDLADPGNAFATDTSPVADTSGSAQSNLSTGTTVVISIVPVNEGVQIADKPGDPDPVISETITGGGALIGANEVLENVNEGALSVTITSAHLTAVDPDNTIIQRQYRITQ